MTLTRESRRIAGLLLLSIVAIESGGYYLTRIVSGAVEVTDFQLGFSRAGHAHAGVLVTLSLIAIVLADAADTALAARGATGAPGATGTADEPAASPAASTAAPGMAGAATPGAEAAAATGGTGTADDREYAAPRMGVAGWVARLGIPTAAILMPAGFFFSSMGAGRTEPNGLVVLLWLGAASLAVGVITLGVRLLRSTRTAEKAPARALQR